MTLTQDPKDDPTTWPAAGLMSAFPPIADIHRPYGEAGAVRQRIVRRDCGTHHEFASRLRHKHKRKFGAQSLKHKK